MWQSAQEAYLESRVASAGPVELVRMLCQGATAAVRQARMHLAEKEIAARSRAISRAYAILMELTASLDRQRGGELAARLARLYDYMQRRLTQANLTQVDGPLVEVLGLLATLTEAWEGAEAHSEHPETQVAPWQTGTAEAEAGGHVWDF